jgi:sec-independent protein translocase protein TatA
MVADVFGVDGIIVLIVVVLVLFGGAAIPKLARNLGSAKNEFEKGVKESSNGVAPTDGTSSASVKTPDQGGSPS